MPKFIKSNSYDLNSIINLKTAIVSSNIIQKLNSDRMSDLNDNYNTQANVIQRCKNAYLPKKNLIYNKHRHKKSNWITSAIVRSISIRDQMYKRLKQMPIESILYDGLKTNLRNYNNILRKSINLAKKTFCQSSFEKCRNDTNKTWSTFKEIIDKTSQRKQLLQTNLTTSSLALV